MFYGTSRQKILGVVFAIFVMGIAHWLGEGFSVGLFGFLLAGYEWVWIGFFICLIFTPRTMAYVGENCTGCVMLDKFLKWFCAFTLLIFLLFVFARTMALLEGQSFWPGE